MSDTEKTRLASAQRAIDVELAGIIALQTALRSELGHVLAKVVGLIAGAKGRVIVSGIGKSGHIARKIASTMASTGTPAMFVHPAEASHGDLGMITSDDVVIMISNSGESLELKDMLGFTRRFKVPLVAITSRAESALGSEADFLLQIPAAAEACPNGLAPTTSTLMQLALGDALAIALLEDKGFTAKDFRNFHPGGKLGANLKIARDIMHKGDALPLISSSALVSDALVEMSKKGFGCAGVVSEGKLAGIITDGDLRRHMSDGLLQKPVVDVMSINPKTISETLLSGEVIAFLNDTKITAVFVVDEAHKPVGLIHMHDLLRAGVN